MKLLILLLLNMSLLFTAMVRAESVVSSEDEKNIINRIVNPLEFTRGQKLFQINCAFCHGKQGEGAISWRKPDADGKNPAPPLNGTGHTWHHSTKSLTQTIKKGTGKIGGNMPAWEDKLSESEIKLILIWITAQWPDEIYTAWYNRFHQKN